MMLMFVRVFIIANLLAFSLSDRKDVRMFFQVCGDDQFPQTSLYPKMIKHFVVELYKATMCRFSHSLRQAVTGAGGPVLHANFDLWTSKMSNEKYIGESTAAFYIDADYKNIIIAILREAHICVDRNGCWCSCMLTT